MCVTGITIEFNVLSNNYVSLSILIIVYHNTIVIIIIVVIKIIV